MKLAVINSSDSTGVASFFIESGKLPSVVVFKEPVPDEIARTLFKDLLSELSQGKPLSLSIRDARNKLRFVEARPDASLPSASWSPTVFQNYNQKDIFLKIPGAFEKEDIKAKGRGEVPGIQFPYNFAEDTNYGNKSNAGYSIYTTSSNDDDDDDDTSFSLDPSQPIVLLLGWVDHEGITSSLQSSDRQYKKKLLVSKPENWESITTLFETYEVSSVLVKISSRVCRLLADKDYADVRNSLFEYIASVPNLVFIHEDVLFGRDQANSQDIYKTHSAQNTLDDALTFLRQHHLEISPYKRNSEVTVIAEAFLDDTERNLIFRWYCPGEKLWSDEADKFLRLFHNYLSKVDQLPVRLDQKRTTHGTIYEFHGQAPSGAHDLSNEFQEFSELMDLCAFDTDSAAALISSKTLDTKEITGIIKRYSKEARRLQLDLKQEAESKVVSIRHRLESELIDLDLTTEDWQNISSVIDLTIPIPPTGTLPLPSQVLRSNLPAQHITYNIRPQIIETVRGVVAQEVSGTQHFSAEHHQMLELIQSHATTNKQELETAVYEIADESGKRVDKLKAGKKIKAFLIEAAKKTGDIAFAVLQKYIESKLGF